MLGPVHTVELCHFQDKLATTKSFWSICYWYLYLELMEVLYSSVMQDNKQRIQSVEVYTTTHGQCQLLNQGASVYVCCFATSTTPVFHPRLLVKLRRQQISLWRCSCRPTIRSMTALHSNGRIKERSGPPLASTSFIFSFPRPSEGVLVTATAH